MVTVSLEIKRLFVDSRMLSESAVHALIKSVTRTAGRVRKRAISLQKRKGKARKPPKHITGKAYARWIVEAQHQPPSPPGQPPFVHSDDPQKTLRWILYGIENDLSAIVGPVGLPRSNSGGKPMPATVEKGGSVIVWERRVANRWVYCSPGFRGVKRRRIAKYEARPFMKPSLDQIAPDMAKEVRFGPATLTAIGPMGLGEAA